MTDRLSEVNVISKLDGGQQSLSWDAGQPTGFLAGVDFTSLLKSPQPEQYIQALPPQVLYFSLKQEGIEACHEVLPHVSQDQFTRICDYDFWEKDRLSIDKAFDLFAVIAELGSEQLYQRFAYLDDEYQLSFLAGKLFACDLEEYEQLPQADQDLFIAMPCKLVYYRILSDNEKHIELIRKIFESLLEHNLKYAYALLNHTHFSLASEMEENIFRFRTARMQEDGFIPYEESLECFSPFDIDALKVKWQRSTEERDALVSLEPGQQQSNFLMDTLALANEKGWDVDDQYAIHQQLLYLVNSLCSAAQVDASDVKGLHRVMEQARALTSLGLEYITDGDHEVALQALKEGHLKTFFRVAISLLHALSRRVLDRLEELSLPHIDKIKLSFQYGRFGQVVAQLDRLAVEVIEFSLLESLRGLFNRFPMMAITESEGCVSYRPVESMADYKFLEKQLNSLSYEDQQNGVRFISMSTKS